MRYPKTEANNFPKCSNISLPVLGIRLNTIIFCTSALAVLFLYIFKSLLLFTGDDIGVGIFCVFTLAFNVIVGIIGDNLDDIVVDDNSGDNFSEEVLDFIPNGNNIGTSVSLFGTAVCEDLLEAAPKVKY